MLKYIAAGAFVIVAAGFLANGAAAEAAAAGGVPAGIHWADCPPVADNPQCTTDDIKQHVEKQAAEIVQLKAALDALSGTVAALLNTVQALESKTVGINRNGAGKTVISDGLVVIEAGDAHFDFPSDGNFNFGFSNGIVCGAANDRSRPNPTDLARCFK